MYFGYRYLSPKQGRWLNRDPLAEDGGVNLYRYCFNNLFNYVDPDGLEPKLPGQAGQNKPTVKEGKVIGLTSEQINSMRGLDRPMTRVPDFVQTPQGLVDLRSTIQRMNNFTVEEPAPSYLATTQKRSGILRKGCPRCQRAITKSLLFQRQEPKMPAK